MVRDRGQFYGSTVVVGKSDIERTAQKLSPIPEQNAVKDYRCESMAFDCVVMSTSLKFRSQNAGEGASLDTGSCKFRTETSDHLIRPLARRSGIARAVRSIATVEENQQIRRTSK